MTALQHKPAMDALAGFSLRCAVIGFALAAGLGVLVALASEYGLLAVG